MRNALFIALTLFAAPAAAASDSPMENADYAFVDITVVSMESPLPAPNRTVLVKGGRILSVGPSDEGAVPPGAIRIDGSGKFLMPGLADMHAHVGFDFLPGRTEERAELLLYLATGVTTLRNAAGSRASLALAQAVENGVLAGPRIESASPRSRRRERRLGLFDQGAVGGRGPRCRAAVRGGWLRVDQDLSHAVPGIL